MSYLSLAGDKNEEEGDFFGSSVGGQSSKLGSLFGMNAQMDRDPNSNQRLTYTAPKPPKPDKPSTEKGDKKTAQQSPGVAIAAAVTAYRYVNDQYKQQGKLGAALLSNFAEKDYKILMYVSKQQPVSTAKITPEFQFNVQPNNYASFYDDQRQMWSVLFDSSEHIINFAKQVCLAKYNCNQNINHVILQDLELGESQTQALASGDSVETVYTGWLVQQQTGTLGAIFDSNHKTDKTFRFKTGKGKVIKGWEQGMLGLRKGGKRFLIIPPSLAYGSKGAGNRVPANSTLAFEVDILRIKHQNAESSASVQSSNSTESLPQTINQPESGFGANLDVPFGAMPAPTNSIAAGDESVKARTASFNEQLSHANAAADSNKAKLLSRMAKMGQPLLPPQPTVVQHSHQVEADQHTAQRPMVAPNSTIPASHTPPQANVQINREISPSPAFANSPVPVVEHQPYMHNPHVVYQQHAVQHPGHAASPGASFGMLQNNAVLAQYQPNPGLMQYSGIQQPNFNSMQQYPVPTTALSGSEILPAILVESQKHSSELKVLMEKMDKVSDKVGEIGKNSESQHQSSSSMETMDAAMLSYNIQRIMQDNEKMKTKMLEKNKQIESQSDKIADLLQQNQKLVEESHAQMEKRNVSFKQTFGQSQERTLQLEQEKVELTNKLSDATSKVCELQLNLANLTERARSLEKIAKDSSGADHSKIQDFEVELSVLRKKLEEERLSKKELEKTFQEKISESDDDLGKKLAASQQSFDSEKKNLLQHIQDIKTTYENQIAALQNKSSSDTSNAEELKIELEKRWKEKCKEAVATVTKAAEEKIEELNSEKQEYSDKLETIQKKFLQLRGMYEEKSKSEEELTEQMEDYESIKERYDNLRKQAVAMKEKYEMTINELRENQSPTTAPVSTDITEQIKSVMNEVFQQVRSEISPSEEYSGKDVLGIILTIVKSTTLKLLRPDESKEVLSEDENSVEEEEEEENDNGDEENQQNTNHIKQNEVDSKAADDKSETEEEDAESVQEVKETPEPTPEGNVEDNAVMDKDVEQDSNEDSPNNEKFPESGPENSVVEEKPAMQAEEEGITDDKIPDIEVFEAVGSREGQTEGKVVGERPASVDGTISPLSDRKPSPPPLFDDDGDDDDDNDWLG